MIKLKAPIQKKWIVIVYMAGDNNLSESMSATFKDFANLHWNKFRDAKDKN